MDAGNAALLLDDADAALNFFRRAENLRPSDGRVKAGMGAAMVRLENPFDALQYFDAATRLGVNSRMIALDRGLAFDLIGNFDRAQQDYAIAGTALNSDALTIRHAISLSLSGKAKQSDNMLDPLLRRNNPAAWRARAFMLAARGDFRKSREVARGFLNVRAAQQVEPFLRRMPNLTAAQQAAAIHLGHFPTRNIGRDNPRIGVASAQIPAQGSLPGAVRVSGSDRLTPAGRPLGAPPTDVAQPVSVAQRMIAEAAVAARNVKPTAAPAFKRPAASSVAVAAAPVRAVSPPAPLPSRITPKKILTTRNEPVAPPASAAVAAVPAIPVITKAAPSISAATPPAVSVSQMTPSAAAPVAPPVTPPAASSAVTSSPPTTTSAGFDSLNSSARPPAASATTAVTPNAIPKAAAIPAPTTQPASPLPSASDVAAAAQIAKPGIIFKPSPGANSAQAQSGAARSAASVTPATSASAASPAAASPSASVQSSAGSFDLGDIVESINIPQSEKQRAVQPVDLAALPKQNVAPAAKPAAQAKPDDPVSAAARFWVQIATGPISAHSGEYRRLSRKYSEVFKGQQGWSSAWNNTGRLVVGPFDGFTAADEWYDALIKAGGDGFVWKSAKGTQVVPLKRK